jgi:hypothetical protein
LNLKVLFVGFLCLLSLYLVSNVAMIVTNAAEGYTYEASTHTLSVAYITNNGIQPMGDPVGPGWPR